LEEAKTCAIHIVILCKIIFFIILLVS